MAQPGHTTGNPYVRNFIVVLFCLVLAHMTVTLAGAAQATSPADTLAPVAKPEPVSVASRALAGTHTFTTDEMSEAYDSAYVGSVEFFRVKKGFMLGFEIGWISGKGTPPLVDSDWVVTDSSVKIWALVLEPKIHYNFLDDTGSELFGPYVAAGPGMWVGGENLSANATRTAEEFSEQGQGEARRR